LRATFELHTHAHTILLTISYSDPAREVRVTTVINISSYKSWRGICHVFLLQVVGSNGFQTILWQVSTSGWSERECRGKAGWFPSTHVEKRQHIPTIIVADVGLHF